MCVLIFPPRLSFWSLWLSGSITSKWLSISDLVVYFCLGPWLNVPLPHVCLTPLFMASSVCLGRASPRVCGQPECHVRCSIYLCLSALSLWAECLCLPATCAMSHRCGWLKVAVASLYKHLSFSSVCSACGSVNLPDSPSCPFPPLPAYISCSLFSP